MNDEAERGVANIRLDRDNPWPGLEAYDESSQDYFSGRASEVEELAQRVAADSVAVLFGKSGLGKTSLLKAGLFPRLRNADCLPVYVRLLVRSDAPRLNEQVRRALVRELEAQGIEHPRWQSKDSLWEYLHRPGLELWTPRNRLVRPVFVFDQFEEIFTLGRALPAQVAQFRMDIADLAENRVPPALAARAEREEEALVEFDSRAMPYTIVIALREDFLADLEGWRVAMPSLRRNRMRLLPMDPKRAFEAVHNDRTKHLVSEPLARRIVSFLASHGSSQSATGRAIATQGDDLGTEDRADATIEPALLSLFCRGVNEHRKRLGKLAFDEALLEGAKDSIVADFYRNSVRGQTTRVRRFIEEQLVTEQGFRNSYAVDDALARGDMTQEALDRLVDVRLLRREQHLGAERVELTHDVLTKAVVEERKRRRAVKRRFIAVAVPVNLLVTALGLGFWGFNASKMAANASKEAESRRLTSTSEMFFAGSDRPLATLLALEGLRRADTLDARSGLLRAMLYAGDDEWSMITLDEQQLGGSTKTIALSPDGRRLAVSLTTENGDQVALWDVSQPKPVKAWSTSDVGDQAVTSIAFSADGTLLAIGRDKSIEVRHEDGGAQAIAPREQPFGPSALAFAWDPTSLAWIGAEDHAIRILNLLDPDAGLAAPLAKGAVALAFQVDSDNAAFNVVGTGDGGELEAYSLTHRPNEKWIRTPIDVEACPGGRVSVSVGGGGFSTTFHETECRYRVDGGKPGKGERFPFKDGRVIREIVWSPRGTAYVQVLTKPELVVGSLGEDRAADDPWVEHYIKDAPPLAYEPDVSGLLSVADDGKRVAVMTHPAEGGPTTADAAAVKVYSLADSRRRQLLLSKLPVAAIASDWRWLAVWRDASPNSAGTTLDAKRVDVFSLDGHLEDPRSAPVPVRGLIPGGAPLVASPTRLIANLRSDANGVGFVAYERTNGNEVYRTPVGSSGLFCGLTLLGNQHNLVAAQCGQVSLVARASSGEVVPGLPLARGDRLVLAENRAVLGVSIPQSPNPDRKDLTIYRVDDEGNLKKLGGLRDLPNPSSLTLSDDGHVVLERRNVAAKGPPVLEWRLWEILDRETSCASSSPIWSSTNAGQGDSPIVEVRLWCKGVAARHEGDDPTEWRLEFPWNHGASAMAPIRRVVLCSRSGEHLVRRQRGSVGHDRNEVFRLESNEVVREIDDLAHEDPDFSFSPNDRWLIAQDERTNHVDVYDLEQGKHTAHMRVTQMKRGVEVGDQFFRIQYSDRDSMLVPLDLERSKQLAGAIVQGVTFEECRRYLPKNAVCRK